MKPTVSISLAAASLAALLASPVHAQLNNASAVRGKVIDQAGQPIAGVAVELEFKGESRVKIVKKTTTDKKGGYIYSGLLPGAWTFHFTKTGYKTTAEESADGGAFYSNLDEIRPFLRGKLTWHRPYVSQQANAENTPDCPVQEMSWRDANAYATWAGLRLPNEAQWEKAALWNPKARRESAFPWGDEPDLAKRANLADAAWRAFLPGTKRADSDIFPHDDGFAHACPVAAFPLGASAYGALNMYGNASEWCEDSALVDGVERHVIRGASWAILKSQASVRRRELRPPDFAFYALGFRVAR